MLTCVWRSLWRRGARHLFVAALALTALAAIPRAQSPSATPQPGAKPQTAAKPQPTAKPKAALPVTLKTWTGDLDGMVKRRIIRVLVPYNRTNYFIDKGVQRGATYDGFKIFEDTLNKKLKTGTLPVNVAFIPTSRDKLAQSLFEGRGDIVAANLTITDARRKLVDFTEPVLDNVKEIVVRGPGAPALASLEDLAGQTINVRQGSVYHENVTALSESLVKKGKKPIVIKPVPQSLEDEDLLEMTNAGLITMTVVDDHIAQFWKQILTAIDVRSDLVVKDGLQVAWAIRKNSPKLKAELDTFAKANRQGTTTGNVILANYLKNTKFARNATSPAEMKKFDNLLAIFRKYGDQYGWTGS